MLFTRSYLISILKVSAREAMPLEENLGGFGKMCGWNGRAKRQLASRLSCGPGQQGGTVMRKPNKRLCTSQQPHGRERPHRQRIARRDDARQKCANSLMIDASDKKYDGPNVVITLRVMTSRRTVKHNAFRGFPRSHHAERDEYNSDPTLLPVASWFLVRGFC